MRPFTALAVTAVAILPAVITHSAWSAERQPLPTSQPAKDPAAQRQLWESRIIFYGDESTNEWSLRIQDQDVDRERQFHFRELWTFDHARKQWVSMNIRPTSARMVTIVSKKKDPDDPNADPVQVLTELPIDKDQMGLFYAKWAVDDVRGSTYFRIGPGLREKDDPILHQVPPEGRILAIIPIDIHHAEAAIIADPRVVCEVGP